MLFFVFFVGFSWGFGHGGGVWGLVFWLVVFYYSILACQLWKLKIMTRHKTSHLLRSLMSFFNGLICSELVNRERWRLKGCLACWCTFFITAQYFLELFSKASECFFTKRQLSPIVKEKQERDHFKFIRF